VGRVNKIGRGMHHGSSSKQQQQQQPSFSLAGRYAGCSHHGRLQTRPVGGASGGRAGVQLWQRQEHTVWGNFGIRKERGTMSECVWTSFLANLTE